MRIGVLAATVLIALCASHAHATQRCSTPELVDALLWKGYDQAPKIDKKGVFEWKDRIAAERLGMTLPHYVVGGVHPGFKQKLCELFVALEGAGFRPGLTSLFRDDYRQEIAEGYKSKTGYSLHGGSRRGGYGNGKAADIVALADTRPEQLALSPKLWQWIDKHGRPFGLGRSIRKKDPMHVVLLSAGEYSANIARAAKAAKAKLAKIFKKQKKKVRLAARR